LPLQSAKFGAFFRNILAHAANLDPERAARPVLAVFPAKGLEPSGNTHRKLEVQAEVLAISPNCTFSNDSLMDRGQINVKILAIFPIIGSRGDVP
jgi:hypothetical protein